MSDAVSEVGAQVKGNGHGDENALLARLRAQHQALTEKRHLDKALPGYSLTVRFKAIDYELIEKIQSRAAKAVGNIGPRAYLNAAADILAQTCVGIFERTDDGLTPLNELLPQWGDEPVCFDNRLAEAVGVDAGESARQVIFNVFAVDQPETGNDVVMMDLADEVVGWIKRGRGEVDGDFS